MKLIVVSICIHPLTHTHIYIYTHTHIYIYMYIYQGQKHTMCNQIYQNQFYNSADNAHGMIGPRPFGGGGVIFGLSSSTPLPRHGLIRRRRTNNMRKRHHNSLNLLIIPFYVLYFMGKETSFFLSFFSFLLNAKTGGQYIDEIVTIISFVLFK